MRTAMRTQEQHQSRTNRPNTQEREIISQLKHE